MRCEARAGSGGEQCDLESGHEGTHVHKSPGSSLTWLGEVSEPMVPALVVIDVQRELLAAYMRELEWRTRGAVTMRGQLEEAIEMNRQLKGLLDNANHEMSELQQKVTLLETQNNILRKGRTR